MMGGRVPGGLTAVREVVEALSDPERVKQHLAMIVAAEARVKQSINESIGKANAAFIELSKMETTAAELRAELAEREEKVKEVEWKLKERESVLDLREEEFVRQAKALESNLASREEALINARAEYNNFATAERLEIGRLEDLLASKNIELDRALEAARGAESRAMERERSAEEIEKRSAQRLSRLKEIME